MTNDIAPSPGQREFGRKTKVTDCGRRDWIFSGRAINNNKKKKTRPEDDGINFRRARVDTISFRDGHCLGFFVDNFFSARDHDVVIIYIYIETG